MRDYLNLSGRTALVTGAARGIGKAIAKGLAEHGVSVFLIDIKDLEGKCTEETLRSSCYEAAYFHCDVSNQEEVQKLASSLGQIDILVNNAGIGARKKSFEEIEEAEWDHMMSVNLKAPFLMCRAFSPRMKRQRWGKIINISSGAGIIGSEFCSHYGSSKAGLIGFTQSIAKELAPYHINVNAIAVPTTLTQMLEETGFVGDLVNTISDIPWGRIGTTKDVADMVLYLASDASEYVTGQVLAPNGGRRTPI